MEQPLDKTQEQDLELKDIEINDLEISDFLDELRLEEGEAISKIMSASCTTCECCCSCVLPLVKEELPQTK